MDISSVNSDLIRGNVTTIILGSLWSQDRYGYDILKEIETKSEGQYKLKQPTLYNQLKRLEKQGLISSYDGDPDDTGGGRRRYYSLTAEGRNFLQKEKSEYEYSRTILDKLVSSQQFDFDKSPAPFNTDDLRPYTKKDNSEKKVVYKEKEVEKVVLVEKKVYLDPNGNEITEEEAAKLAEEAQNKVLVDAEQAAAEEERRRELEQLAREKEEELARIEEERRIEAERIEEERKAEAERIEAERRAEREMFEREKREKEEAIARLEEERKAEAERLNEERKAELERLQEAHNAEILRLQEEKRLAEEEIARKQDTFEEERKAELARIEEERKAEIVRIEEERKAELARLEEERIAAERKFAEEQARFEAEKRIEEERRAEAERIDNERRTELARIEEERKAAEKRFEEEREKFREEKRIEEERRAELERIERERAEEIERIAREREEALRSQATMSLADVFKELDAKSEYETNSALSDKLIVEEAQWQVAAPLPVYAVAEEKTAAEEVEEQSEKAENAVEIADSENAIEKEEQVEEIDVVAAETVTAEETEAKDKSEEVAADCATALQNTAATVTLKEIFEQLDAKSEYSEEKSGNDTFVIDEANWHVEQQKADEEKQREEERRAAAEAERLAALQAEIEENNRKRDEERQAELKRLAEELASVKERLAAHEENVLPATIIEEPEQPATVSEDNNEAGREAQRTAAAASRIITSEIWQEQARLHEEKEAKEEINYFSAERVVDERQAPQATLSDIFRKLDEKEAEIDAKNATTDENTGYSETEQVAYTQPEESVNFGEYDRPIEAYSADAVYAQQTASQSAPADTAEASIHTDGAKTQLVGTDSKGEFVTSAVLGKRTDAFEYEKENVNYREFFSSIASVPEEKAEPAVQEHTLPKADTDLKARLYADGFKMRPYDRGNTSEYYTFNFIQANRLNRDSWLIVLAIFLVEVAIMWLSTARQISWIYFLPIMLGGAVLMLLPTFAYLANPTKRKRADFNVKLSVINRGMIMIELAVILVLVAFFAVGVSVNDETLILMTMVLPIILLTNLPLSSIVYYLLYRTKKYHTA